MSHLPTHRHDPKPRHPQTRVEVAANEALAATGAATPSAELVPLTREAEAWLASLPAPVRVHSLAALAPDLVNQLAAAWHDVSSTALLLEQWLLDRDVRSRPPIIASELLRLYVYDVRCRAADAPSTTWELPVSGLQDLSPIAASRGSHS